MPDHLDLCRDDIQLFGGYRTDLGQGIAIMRTELLGLGDLVDDLDPGQTRAVVCDPVLARVCGDDSHIVIHIRSGGSLALRFGFVEQADLIG